jgi:acetyltransferase-like isoleucine patch superfamily enzyme
MARDAHVLAQQYCAGIVAFIDGTEESVGQSLLGLPIRGRDAARSLLQPPTMIAIASTWWREIGVDLINLGFRPGEDFFPVQRRLAHIKWQGDSQDPIPLYVGHKSYGYEGMLCYHRVVRPTYVGAFCSIAVGARLAVNHCYRAISTHPFLTHREHGILAEDRLDRYESYNQPIEVGNDVWIGYNACILPGVKLGNGCVVGANAVVTKDVPPYAIVVGCPARVLRYRFTERQIQLLEAVKWWTWSDRRLREHVDDLHDAGRFFRLAERIVSKVAS